ncbi:MAG: hypothetical protein V1900_04685 [Candidatus Aenigmatarchaeota archaeon]
MQMYLLFAVIVYVAFLMVDAAYFIVPAISFGLYTNPFFFLILALILLPLVLLFISLRFKKYERILSLVTAIFITIALIISITMILSVAIA